MMSQSNESGKQRKPLAGSRWEWIAAAVSLLLVVAAVGYLVYEGVRHPESPPAIEVRADTVISGAGGFLVEFEAHNHGRETAAAVRVEGTLEGEGGMLEVSEATLDFLPGESRRRGGMYFSRDPRQHHLRLRATGYERP